MERLTKNKSVSEMGMYELAHNSCYIDTYGATRYRDYENDIDARDFARRLMVKYGEWKSAEQHGLDADNELVDDDIFDDTMLDNLMYDVSEIKGLIALFYRNLWAMSELRERLKYYEDLEEHGLLLKLPYNIQTCGILYYADERDAEIYRLRAETIEISKMMISNKFIYTIDGFDFFFEDFGKIVFETKKEAEAALERMGE